MFRLFTVYVSKNFFTHKLYTDNAKKEKQMIHTVKSGDTVYKIAKAYGVPMSRIIIDNGLEDPSRLAVGEDLVILTPAVVYTVRPGDTLYSIAKRYSTTVNTLLQNNPNLNGSSLIYPDQTLVISFGKKTYDRPLSVNGFAYPYIEDSVLRKTLPYLTYLSIFTYGIKNNGELIAPADDARLIETAKEYGTVPLMMLTSLTEDGNFSNELISRILSDEALKNKVITEAVAEMKRKGYGGINADFEYISPKYADSYADFLTKLKANMGNAYRLHVCLAPKTGPMMRGLLYEGLNYEKLGAAADKVTLMTYEWGYSYGPPLAVSPINKVREVVDYAVKVIPREKILMGMPNYGYNWALPYVRGQSVATSLSNAGAVELAKEKNAAIEFDERSQSPFYNYYDVQPRTNAIKHVVWFQNAKSNEAMLDLVEEYGLDGVSVWNIMKYFPAMWSVINSAFTIKKE